MNLVLHEPSEALLQKLVLGRFPLALLNIDGILAIIRLHFHNTLNLLGSFTLSKSCKVLW